MNIIEFIKGLFYKQEQKAEKIIVLEDVRGNFRYHIGVAGRSLCGRDDVMSSRISLDVFGQKLVTHLKENYCSECERIAKESGVLKA
jgi:hypothetical protein